MPKLNGYVWIKMPSHHRAIHSGFVCEHIVVMEKKLGRALSENEVVHHIDGNKTNNDPSNLELYSNNGEHVRMHFKKRHIARGIDDRICTRCGVDHVYWHKRFRYSLWRRSKIVKGWLCGKCYNVEWRMLRLRNII